MARSSSKFLRLIRWQYIRWGLAIPALPLALWACNSHPLKEPLPAPQMETDFEVLVTPEREVDILFMVDNSPSMDPKQQKLATNFPAMIKVLEGLEGGLPDIHVGVVSSDFGAGGGELGSNCGTPLGNRGLLWGNDNSATATGGIDAKSGYNQFATVANISGACGLHQGARWIEDIQNPNGAGRQKNYDGTLVDSFSCLAKAVGTKGCGEEHHLQSIRVALNPQAGINDANNGFLRSKAYLAVVLIADEDDCSADPYSTPGDANHPVNNDNMFNNANLNAETTSLRCAGRGHVWKGQAIPNYDATNGYTGKDPLDLPFAEMAAREPQPAGETNAAKLDYHWLPLIPIQTVIDSVLNVKNGNKGKILVSGIIGWPQNDDLSNVRYQYGKDSTSMPAQLQTLWDYMPICKLDQKSADGNVYKGYGGLRLKKFIDAFKGDEKNVFSICDNDFTVAMTQIGNAIAQKLRPGCVQFPLIDTEPSTTPRTLQPECRVLDRIPCDAGSTGCLASGYKQQTLLECKDSAGNALNPKTANNKDANGKTEADRLIPEDKRDCWYLSYDDNKITGCPNAYLNQKISALRKSGTVAPPGTMLAMKCLTCPDSTGASCKVCGGKSLACCDSADPSERCDPGLSCQDSTVQNGNTTTTLQICQ
jgi:hypothetical protein